MIPGTFPAQWPAGHPAHNRGDDGASGAHDASSVLASNAQYLTLQ